MKNQPQKIVLAEDLEEIGQGESYPVPCGTIVSALARETAQRKGIDLIEAPQGLIGLGADHGGFAMKEEVKAYLDKLGYAVHDFGVHDENPVDYPDVAHRVARAVSQGICPMGILVDGAGIGSAMAANKVPGIRAALCYDEATARNSREHNYANILTLGGRMQPLEAIQAIVRSWLETPYGPQRHRRRVDKITQIEKRYSRS